MPGTRNLFVNECEVLMGKAFGMRVRKSENNVRKTEYSQLTTILRKNTKKVRTVSSYRTHRNLVGVWCFIGSWFPGMDL